MELLELVLELELLTEQESWVTLMQMSQSCAQESPLYEMNEAGRLLNISPRTIHRWYEGFEVVKRGSVIRYPAWMHQPQDGILSFWDLIELWFVKRFQNHKVPLHIIRSTYRIMGDKLKSKHPFLRKNEWLIVGRSILAANLADDPEAIIEPATGQLYLDKIALEVGKSIEFDPDNFVRRWFPLGSDRPLVVDPEMNHGFPAVPGRRISSKHIYQLWGAENKDSEVVKSAFNISQSEFEAAIEWERLIRN